MRNICPQAPATVAEARLSIPHPRIHERRFVPAPMTELARDRGILSCQVR